MEHCVPKFNRFERLMDDARVIRSREGLRQALIELLRQRPLDQISIRDVTASSGVGYTTFFRHYPNKEALLDDVIAQEVGELVRLTTPVYDGADSMAACVALCAHIDQNRSLWAALLTGGAAGAVKEELLAQGRKASVARPVEGSLPADLGVALAIAVMVELMSWWLRQADPWPVARVAEILHRTGIRPAMEAGGFI
jgi:AcrR family transcriptional regulator